LPSCGLTPHFGDGWYSVDALPAGACDLYTLGCSMRAHRGCQCPNEVGPVDSFVCLCQGDDWTCQVTSQQDAVCADACSVDAGAADAGSAGPCELTSQLALSDPTVGGEFNIGGDLLVGATLTNRGPRDHNAYPGIEVTTNVNLGSTNLLTTAAYALRSGESIKLGVTVRVPAALACVPITFHIRARSFGAETTCSGPSVDTGIVLNAPTGGNCPACPVIGPSDGDSCSPQGLSCRYDCAPANCDCHNGHWLCQYCI
jgi:hypothetical protein